jgi:hypothetical protein
MNAAVAGRARVIFWSGLFRFGNERAAALGVRVASRFWMICPAGEPIANHTVMVQLEYRIGFHLYFRGRTERCCTE